MGVTVWNVGDPLNYVEIVKQGYAVARGGQVKNFFNVFHFRRTNTVNILSKVHIEDAFQTAIGAKMLLALNVDYNETINTCRYFENALDPATQFDETGVGAITGDRGPDFMAVTLQLKSAVRGRAYRGSKHFGPVAESDTTGDALVSGAQTRYSAIGTAIITGFTDSDGNVWVPGLKGSERASSPAHYTTNPTTTVWTDITSFVLNITLGTMKRRKVRTVT